MSDVGFLVQAFSFVKLLRLRSPLWGGGALSALFLVCPQVRGQSLELEEVVVVASRLEETLLRTAGTATSITADELINRGSVDLVDALQREPGVSIPFDFAGVDTLVPFLSGGSNSINIRGLEGNRVSLNIDGIRQPDDFTSRSFNGSGGPGRVYFDPAVFAQIELFKSASSSLYGSDALAGTVLGRTESPFTLLGFELDGSTFRSTTTYASVNQSLNERLAGAVGNGEHAFSFVYSYRLGQETEANGATANPLSFESHAAVVKGAFNFGNVTLEPTFDFYVLDSQNSLDSTEVASQIGQTETGETFNDRTRERYSIDATWNSPTDSILQQVSLQSYYQRARAETLNFQVVDQGINGVRDRVNDIFFDTEIYGVNASANLQFDTGPLNHLLQINYDGSLSNVSSELFRDTNGLEETSLGLAPARVLRNGISISDRIAFGAEERFVITPAVRFEDYRVTPENTEAFLDETTFEFVTRTGQSLAEFGGTQSVPAADYQNFFVAPSVNALFQITDTFNMFLTSSRGVRNPTAEELVGVFQHLDDFITLPNPDLQEETSWSNEIGFRYDDGSKKFEVVGYWNFYDDFIFSGRDTGLTLAPPAGIPPGLVDEPGILQTENVGEVEIFGFESSGSWAIGEDFSFFEGFTLGGSFSIGSGEVLSPSDVAGPLNTVEPWKASGWLSYDHPSESWGLNLTATYANGLEEGDINPQLANAGGISETEDYLLLDLLGYVKINDHLSLRGGVKNLLDQEYVLPSRAVRGSGHNGGALTAQDNQPGINGFVALELQW